MHGLCFLLNNTVCILGGATNSSPSSTLHLYPYTLMRKEGVRGQGLRGALSPYTIKGQQTPKATHIFIKEIGKPGEYRNSKFEIFMYSKSKLVPSSLPSTPIQQYTQLKDQFQFGKDLCSRLETF